MVQAYEPIKTVKYFVRVPPLDPDLVWDPLRSLSLMLSAGVILRPMVGGSVEPLAVFGVLAGVPLALPALAFCIDLILGLAAPVSESCPRFDVRTMVRGTRRQIRRVLSDSTSTTDHSRREFFPSLTTAHVTVLLLTLGATVALHLFTFKSLSADGAATMMGGALIAVLAFRCLDYQSVILDRDQLTIVAHRLGETGIRCQLDIARCAITCDFVRAVLVFEDGSTAHQVDLRSFARPNALAAAVLSRVRQRTPNPGVPLAGDASRD